MIKFIGIKERETTTTIDGYSTAKTINGAIKDFGRYIAKHVSMAEGNNLISFTADCIQEPSKDCDYYLTIEEVACASRLNESQEIEYSKGNFYICLRFVK